MLLNSDEWQAGVLAARWRFILRRGYVGQESFVGAHEVTYRLRTSKPTTLLDIGCGSGAMVCEIARKLQTNATGVDLDDAALARATARANIRCPERVDFRRIDFDMLDALLPRQWDAIISLDALQASHDLFRTISNIENLWNRRSHIFITLWSFETRVSSLAQRWGFQHAWSTDTVRSICDASRWRLQCRRRSRLFCQRTLGSLAGLMAMKTEWRRLGGDTVRTRLALERDTVKAAQAGLVTQMLISGRPCQRP
jgi:SAM-dependent methyltransferase